MRSLQREVAHEHGLGLDLAGVAVLELGIHVQRCGVGVILLLAFLHGVTRLFEVRIGEGQARKADIEEKHLERFKQLHIRALVRRKDHGRAHIQAVRRGGKAAALAARHRMSADKVFFHS